MSSTDRAALAAALTESLPAGAVLTGVDDLERYAHDDAEWAPYETPAAVVLATCLQDVVTTVRLAGSHGAPVVPRGAGTGLSGGANATAGAVVLSLERMTRILEVDAAERFAVVEAGVRVRRGEVVGAVSVGGHAHPGTVHLGARRNGEYLNPLVLLGAMPRAVLVPYDRR